MFQIVSAAKDGYKSPGRSFHPSPWDLQSRKISWIRLFPSISKQIPRHLYFPQEAQKNKKERENITSALIKITLKIGRFE